MSDVPNIRELVHTHSVRAPASPAVMCAGSVVSYSELDTSASQLAQHLRSHGLSAGSRVGIYLERPSDDLVALLGTIEAGCVSVPLGPNQPPARAAHIFERSNVSVVLADRQLGSRITLATPKLWLEDLATPEGADYREPSVLESDEPACVLYRSGSDGKPAGVPISHAALIKPVGYSALNVTSIDRIAQPMDLSRDVCFFNVMNALVNGACVVDVPARGLPPRKCATILNASGVTIWLTSASELKRIATDFPSSLKNLRLILSDDPFALWDQARVELNSDLLPPILGLYGQVETGGCWLTYRIGDYSASAVVDGVFVHLLDERKQPVRDGFVGEVYVESAVVALGYDSELENAPTAFAAKLEPGTGRVFRTGDLGHRVNGGLELKGRTDRQVIMNGERVQPEEVEAVLRQHFAVRAAQVRAVGNHATNKRELVATVIPENGQLPTPDEIRSFCREHLPEVMIPRVVIDPQSGTEEDLMRIWCDVLKKDQVGTSDNFFDLGGHSMGLVQVGALIKRRLGRKVSLTTLLTYPTIGSLASHLDQARP